jgi:D-alanine-D-alanine ligase
MSGSATRETTTAGAGVGRAGTGTKTIAVLKGGRSLERGVSLRSGAQVEDSLQRLGHTAVSTDVGPELVRQLRAAGPDAAFIAMHGGEGEDGTVQELLTAIGIPYTGSGPAACVRCADKVLAKYLLREAGIPTPEFHAFSEASVKQLGGAAALGDVERELGFPLVIKPACQGSALGVKFARSASEVPGALVSAFSYDRKVLLERHVPGRDLAVSVLDGPDPGRGPVALPIVEAVPRAEDFYDFESRYEIGQTTFVCPAELPDETTARAQEMALAAYRLLGCHGFARIDLMLDRERGEPTVLETNVVPGLTETSLLPQAADAAGIDFDGLVERMLASAWSRSER